MKSCRIFSSVHACWCVCVVYIIEGYHVLPVRLCICVLLCAWRADVHVYVYVCVDVHWCVYDLWRHLWLGPHASTFSKATLARLNIKYVHLPPQIRLDFSLHSSFIPAYSPATGWIEFKLWGFLLLFCVLVCGQVLNMAGNSCKNKFPTDFTYMTYHLSDAKTQQID